MFPGDGGRRCRQARGPEPIGGADVEAMVAELERLELPLWS